MQITETVMGVAALHVAEKEAGIVSFDGMADISLELTGQAAPPPRALSVSPSQLHVLTLVQLF
jgi:hypothetical protein